jgi:hypothetical protein
MNLKSKFKMVNPHCPDIPVADTNKKLFEGPFNVDGPADVAYINHYLCKTREDYSMRCERGRSDMMTRAKIEEWEERAHIDIDTLDINALKFMYGDDE